MYLICFYLSLSSNHHMPLVHNSKRTIQATTNCTRNQKDSSLKKKKKTWKLELDRFCSTIHFPVRKRIESFFVDFATQSQIKILLLNYLRRVDYGGLSLFSPVWYASFFGPGSSIFPQIKVSCIWRFLDHRMSRRCFDAKRVEKCMVRI